MIKNRPYLFLEMTTALCSQCLRKVDAKIIEEEGQIWMRKWCPEHGSQHILMADDAAYWKQARTWIKPSEMPQIWQSKMKHGCPFDCGLCPDHEQHSCLSVLEITESCNLACPICYADSSPQRTKHRSLEQIRFLIESIVRSEGEPDIVQISGGEPTIHPQFFEILDMCKEYPIRHLMLNTNGLRIAKDRTFVERLASYGPGFEVYLQFDSLQSHVHQELRGLDLTSIRAQALAHLDEFNLSTTLVVVLKKGLNDQEIGDIVRHGLEHRCVRGVTLQPVQVEGRTQGFDPKQDRLTLSEVRRKLIEQFPDFQAADVLPVPCHPDALAMAYGLRNKKGFQALTHLVPKDVLLQGGKNTIVFERDEELKARLIEAYSTAHSPISAASSFAKLLCCLPGVKLPEIQYDQVFRVIIMAFADRHNLDMRSVKKSCVHIVHTDGRMIPFETYNMFYREGLSLPEHITSQIKKA